MAWWKLSSEVLNLKVFREISKAVCKGDHSEFRFVALIKLICASADGKTFKTFEDFAFMTDTSMKQAQIVWDICIRDEVLRKATNGQYSALDWMTENKMIGSATAGKANARQIRAEQAIPEQKTHLSEHVLLTAAEHTELLSTLGERKFRAVIDKLENYKATSGKKYASDYEAINRWVIDAVEKEEEENESHREAYQELSDEEQFKKLHYGKTPEEYAAQKAWQNSEEGKRQIEGYKQKLQMILGGFNNGN